MLHETEDYISSSTAASLSTTDSSKYMMQYRTYILNYGTIYNYNTKNLKCS